MDSRVKHRLVIAAAAAGFLVLAGCAQPDAPAPDDTTVPPVPPTAVSPTEEPADPADEDESLEGEPSLFGPEAGADMTIVGVEYPGTIALLETPGETASVISDLDPLTAILTATGNNWSLPDSTWYELDSGERTGWVNARNLTQLGQTDDATSAIVEAEGRFSADSIEELGLQVAEFYASDEPPSRVVKSGPAERGDLHEVTYDVVGLGDDSVMGYRLHVFGLPAEDAAETETTEGAVTLRTVERTVMCARGVTGEGLCV